MAAAILTPLLYLALAAAILWLAAATVGPISRRSMAVLLLLPLCFTGRALLTGRVYGPIDIPHLAAPLAAQAAANGVDGVRNGSLIDVAGQLIPWQAAVRSAWAHGQWPLHNPFSLTGDALAGGAQAAPYDPVHLAGLLLPLPHALTFQATIVLFLAALGMFLFLVDLGCRDLAALVGAAGWAFSGFLGFWLEYPMGSVVALLPLVMLGVRRIARRPTAGSWALLLVAFVLIILGGHPESTLHLVAIAAVYGLWELVAARKGTRFKAVLLAAAAGTCALMVSAVFVLPIADTMGQTWQHALRRQVFAKSDRSLDLRQVPLAMAPSLVPFVVGVAGSEVVPADALPPRTHPWTSGYAGSVLLAPALFGLFWSRWRGRWIIAGIGLFGLLAGASAPGVSELLARLPLFDISLNDRLVFAVPFAIAVLAGLGLEAWADRPRSSALGWLQLALLFGVGGVILGLWSWMRGAGLSREFLITQAGLELVPMAVLAVVYLVRRTPTAVVLGAVLAVLLVQRSAEGGPTYPTLPVRAFYPVVAPLDALPLSAPEPYRIVGLDYVLPPNYATMYGLEDVRGNTPLTFRPFRELYPLWCKPQLWFNLVHELDSPMLSFLNVRFALASHGRKHPPGWQRVTSANGVVVWENPRVLGRAFVPEAVTIDLDPKLVPKRMAEVHSLARRAWIDSGATGAARSFRREDNGPGKVSIRRAGLGYLIDARMEKPGWVVVSENAWRGWRATVGGRSVPLRRADHAFLAFHLDAGQQVVRLTYRPTSFVVGAAISASTLALLILGSAILRSRQRMRR